MGDGMSEARRQLEVVLEQQTPLSAAELRFSRMSFIADLLQQEDTYQQLDQKHQTTGNSLAEGQAHGLIPATFATVFIGLSKDTSRDNNYHNQMLLQINKDDAKWRELNKAESDEQLLAYFEFVNKKLEPVRAEKMEDLLGAQASQLLSRMQANGCELTTDNKFYLQMAAVFSVKETVDFLSSALKYAQNATQYNYLLTAVSFLFESVIFQRLEQQESQLKEVVRLAMIEKAERRYFQANSFSAQQAANYLHKYKHVIGFDETKEHAFKDKLANKRINYHELLRFFWQCLNENLLKNQLTSQRSNLDELAGEDLNSIFVQLNAGVEKVSSVYIYFACILSPKKSYDEVSKKMNEVLQNFNASNISSKQFRYLDFFCAVIDVMGWLQGMDQTYQYADKLAEKLTQMTTPKKIADKPRKEYVAEAITEQRQRIGFAPQPTDSSELGESKKSEKPSRRITSLFRGKK